MADSTERDAPAVLDCEQWEAWLADRTDQMARQEARDASAGVPDEAAFAEHARRCPGCGELMEQARQGREWLRVLGEKSPAPPVELLSKILAQTRGAGLETDFPIGTAAAAGVAGALPGSTFPARWGIPFLPASAVGAGQRAHHARMVMTAAMAFFSVALTLSLAGVKLTSVHAAELRPQAMQANMTRSFYGTKKQVVSFYENLRLVYEVESKMQDLRREAEPSAKPVQPAAAPGKTPAPGAAKPKSGGAAQLRGGEKSGVREARQAPESVVRGWPESARAEALGVRPTVPAFARVCNSAMVRRGASSKERKLL